MLFDVFTLIGIVIQYALPVISLIYIIKIYNIVSNISCKKNESEYNEEDHKRS